MARDFGLYSKCRKEIVRGKGETGEGEGENCGNGEERNKVSKQQCVPSACSP